MGKRSACERGSSEIDVAKKMATIFFQAKKSLIHFLINVKDGGFLGEICKDRVGLDSFADAFGGYPTRIRRFGKKIRAQEIL
jgi:uncharacterized protein (UPF0128 family)